MQLWLAYLQTNFEVDVTILKGVNKCTLLKNLAAPPELPQGDPGEFYCALQYH